MSSASENVAASTTSAGSPPRASFDAPLQHVVTQVFRKSLDSPLAQTLYEEGITSILDLLSLEEDDLRTFSHTTDNGTPVYLHISSVRLVLLFQSFIREHVLSVSTLNDDKEWFTLSANDFNSFRLRGQPPPTFASAPASTSASASISAALRDFRRGMKRDVTQFISFKDEAQWDNWHRSTIAQAHAQGVADVLDASFKPSTSEDKELFREKQVLMYAVFEQTLKTDKGKALV